MTLPFRDWTKEAIAILERLAPTPSQTWRFVVKATPQDDEIAVEPISILRDENSDSPVFHLAFDSLPQPSTEPGNSDDVPTEEVEETDAVEVVETTLRSGGSLRNVLTEINRRLEAIAEAGIQTGMAAHREWFANARSEVFNFGFTPLARALDALSKPPVSANAVVKARYLTHLYSQATEHLR